jgi:hypothetical protein
VAGNDLAGHGGARLGVAEHGDLDLAGGDALLDDDPLVVCRRQGNGIIELGRVVHFGHAHRRPQVRRLDEDRVAQPRACQCVGGGIELGVTQGGPRHVRQPMHREDLFGLDLVHGQRGRQHAGADVRHAGELEQSLNSAVLALRPVQQGQDHDRQVVVRRRDRAQWLDRRSRRLQALERGVQRGRTTCQRRLGVVGLHPCALARDAHGEDVVAIGIDRTQHVGGGGARNLVLGRLPAEQDDEPDAVGTSHGQRE